MATLRRRGFTLIELVVVIGILALLISILLPALSRARKASLAAKMNSSDTPLIEAVSAASDQNSAGFQTAAAIPAKPAIPLAQISSFDAKVGLTPHLSVGTAEPESIYTATFDATLIASAAADANGDSEIQLPLPPRIISLGDLSLTVNGHPSDDLSLGNDQLIWHGPLPTTPSQVRVQYTAVGQGLYSLQTPPGKIIDHFKIELTAVGSDVQMLELSLQPTSFSHASDQTTYVWDYARLMFGRPISLDVLGIAPIDRLGELYWLGPLSVFAFGIILGLMARAFDVVNFDRWMLLLVLGTFTGAYPLMYFAQQFIPLDYAMAGSGAIVLLIIAWRVISLMGWKLGLVAVIFPAGAIMALTLEAAVHPNLEGILITALTLGLFMLAMLLAPRLHMPTMPAVKPTLAT